MLIGFYATLRPIVGGKTIDVDLPGGATVRELVDHLITRFPELGPILIDEETGTLSRRVHVFVDGRSAIYLDEGLETPLSTDRRVDVFPAIAGG